MTAAELPKDLRCAACHEFTKAGLGGRASVVGAQGSGGPSAGATSGDVAADHAKPSGPMRRGVGLQRPKAAAAPRSLSAGTAASELTQPTASQAVIFAAANHSAGTITSRGRGGATSGVDVSSKLKASGAAKSSRKEADSSSSESTDDEARRAATRHHKGKSAASTAPTEHTAHAQYFVSQCRRRACYGPTSFLICCHHLLLLLQVLALALV